MNKPDKKVSLAVWSLVLAVFTLVAFHVPFFRHLSANVEAGTNGIVIAVTAALLLLVLDFLLYYVLAWLLRFVGKCIVAFTLFGDAVMLYFVNNYDVLVTDEMMGNVFRTQYSEASGFFSFSFILYILLLCVVPCIYVFGRKVEYGSWKKLLGWIGGCVAALLVLVFGNMKNWPWIDRNSTELGSLLRTSRKSRSRTRRLRTTRRRYASSSSASRPGGTISPCTAIPRRRIRIR